ncbi:tRNA epoxyqueuosine(34) reductase QueG, partial [Herbaspirillum sp. VT-16-41]
RSSRGHDSTLSAHGNKSARAPVLPVLAPREGLDSASLVALFGWSEEQFLKNPEGSAIRRIGHDRWLRNLAVGLGNAADSPSHKGDGAIVAALRARRVHPPALVVEQAPRALAGHGAGGP